MKYEMHANLIFYKNMQFEKGPFTNIPLPRSR